MRDRWTDRWKMLFCTLVIVALPIQIFGCGNVDIVPQIQKRSRLYESTSREGYLDDSFLQSDWYLAVFNKTQYLMPDNNTVPSVSSCGGLKPIYLKDEHPDVKTMNETPVDAIVCIKTNFAECDFTESIQIRKCKDGVQYYLVPTFKRSSSYCFDDPDIYGVVETAFVAAPTQVTIGKVAVKPTLEYIDRKPNIKLLCEMTSVSGDVKQLKFQTLWFINTEFKVLLTTTGETVPLYEKDLPGLGQNISCGVRLSNNAPNGKMTPTFMSDIFFAGIKVSNTDVTILKGDKDTKIYLTRTVPFGCRDDGCVFAVQMFISDKCSTSVGGLTGKNPKGIVGNQKGCGVEFEGTDMGKDISLAVKEKEMLINTIDMTTDDPKYYTLQLKVQSNNDHKIWDNYMLEPISVTVNDDQQYKNKICKALVDPHMTTFRQYSYEHQHLGDFILYRNIKYETEVQIRTKLCNNNIAKCACAIAIRAGGDVFRMNYCSTNLRDWETVMTSCKDNGIIIIKEDNTFLTPIGTQIKVDFNKETGLMNIQIRLAPKDVNNADGLCGNFGQGPEIVDRSGRPTNDHRPSNGQNFHDKFSEAWRINSNDKNYLNDNCYAAATQWTQADLSTYCYCESNSNSSARYTSEAKCSPSQYSKCGVESPSYTDTLCRKWDTRCNFNKHRKKREATLIQRHFEDYSYIKEKKRSFHKRQTRVFTESDANKLCTESIANHPAFSFVKEATAEFNISQAIANCVFDTYEGQTDSWVQSYISVVTDVVNMNMEIDPNYTRTHANEVVTFRRLACPLNCSGNGMCTDEGNCSCNEGFRGSDCSINISAALTIYGLKGNKFCDIDENDCDVIEIKTFDLVKGFVCKVEERKILTDGKKINSSTTVLEGEYISLFTAWCNLQTQRNKRSFENNYTVLASEYDVSISNDGNSFSEKVKIILFDPTCQVIGNMTDGGSTVYLKDNTCFIGGKCYLPFESSKDDVCYKCVPSAEPLIWTIDCSKTDSILDESGLPVYAVVIVSIIPVVIIAVAVTAFVRWKKNKKLPRVESPGRSKIGPEEFSLPIENTVNDSKTSIRSLNS